MIALLITKIATFFLMILSGFGLVKTKILQPEDIRGLSRIALYLVIPCVILRAFSTELTDAVGRGMILAFGVAIAVHILFFAAIPVLRKYFKMNEVELLSVIYPNAGNLAVPLVAAVLGWDYVIYSSAYIMVQQFLIWSHGRMLMQQEVSYDWKKLFLNVNILATLAGFLLLLTQYQLPKVVMEAVCSVADMVGPVTMLISGILLASTKVSTISAYPGWWKVIVFRLILFPLLFIVLFKYSGISGAVADGRNILLVTLFAVVTPPATSLTLMAEVYHKDAIYANLLNVAATLLFLITMPLVLMLYLC